MITDRVSVLDHDIPKCLRTLVRKIPLRLAAKIADMFVIMYGNQMLRQRSCCQVILKRDTWKKCARIGYLNDRAGTFLLDQFDDLILEFLCRISARCHNDTAEIFEIRNPQNACLAASVFAEIFAVRGGCIDLCLESVFGSLIDNSLTDIPLIIPENM